MFGNTYEGLLEDWKVELICRRARRMGFQGFDLDDAQQQVAVSLLSFEFDESRSNGATESTALTAVIDRQLAMIRRAEARARRRDDLCSERSEAYCQGEQTELAIDVQRVVEQLPDVDRQICAGLSDGRSVNELAKSLGLSWHAVRDRIRAIRRHFEKLGLSLGPNGALA